MGFTHITPVKIQTSREIENRKMVLGLLMPKSCGERIHFVI